MAAPNAAIYYRHEAFSTDAPKLMGRNAAGAGFLAGFARNADVERFIGYAKTRKEFERFAAAVGGRGLAVDWVPHGSAEGLQQAGTLFVYSPGIADFCWQRAPSGDGAWSVVGLTHTISSERVMEDFGRFLTAPAERWDALICTSEAVRRTAEGVLARWGEWLGERFGAAPPKPRLQLPVIPLGVDCDAFAFSERTRTEFRRTHAIGTGEVAFLFLGRLSFHAKAHPLPMYFALEAAAARTRKPLTLILAGYFFNEAIQRAFLDGARRYCPSVRLVHVDARQEAERAGAWAGADVFTSLSDNIQESFGLAPVEAMAAGLPAVVTDWDGYRDTVVDGETGVCVPTAMPEPGSGEVFALRYLSEADTYDEYIGRVSQCTAVDVAAVAHAYVAMIEDPALRRRLGEAGRERARRSFDWRVVVRRYQELWHELGELRQGMPARATPPYPLRDDPFKVFRAFPSLAIGSRTVVEPLARDPAKEAARIAAEAMNAVALPFLLDQAEFQQLFGALAPGKRLAVGELEGLFPRQRKAALVRSLGWLAKGGVIRLSVK